MGDAMADEGARAARIGAGPIDWSDWSDDPYPLYRELRAHHPVFFDEGSGEYLISRYSDVAEIVTDAVRFSNVMHKLPVGILDDPISPIRGQDPPRQTSLRRIVAPLFSPKAMKANGVRLTATVRDLLDPLADRDTVEISSSLAIPLPGRVACDLLGLPIAKHAQFLRLTEERRKLLHLRLGAEELPVPPGMRKWEDVRGDLWEIVAPIAHERRRRPEIDAISMLIEAQERDGRDQLSDELVIDVLLHLLTAGFHTTQHLIEMLFDILADRPDLWRHMRSDRSLVPVAIEEMLRYDSPVQAIPRRVVQAAEIAGTTIPGGAALKMVFGSANRDERAFPNADDFRLDRKANRHFAFSSGIHLCPGAPVSRAEVKILLDEMLDRYPSIARAGPSLRWPSGQTSVTNMRGLRSVPVHLSRT